MTFREHCTIVGIGCDARNCEAIFEAGPVRYSGGYTVYEGLATTEGWTGWAGSRTLRHYCPSHGPSPRAQMWQTWGRIAEGGDRGE